MNADKPTPIEAMSEELAQKTPRRRVLRRLLRAEIYYGAALSAFAVLTFFAYYNAYFGWDVRVAQSIQSLRFAGMLAFMRAVSVIGNDWHPYALATVTILGLLILRFRAEAGALAFSTAGSAILNGVIKTLIARPRPSTDLVTVVRDMESQSFPSGHVTFYVCYFGFLFFAAYALLPKGSPARRLALFLLALPVLLVGLSRVYLGAHWPSDTLGGYVFSGLWLGLSLHLYRWLKKKTDLTLDV
jgi:undecaprenyl-diphosphatase